MSVEIMERPDWGRPGLPLPTLTAGTRYSGTGSLFGAGKVVTTRIRYEWETIQAWKARSTSDGQTGPGITSNPQSPRTPDQ